MEIALVDGATITERVRAVRGTADNPMTREEVMVKSYDLLSPTLGAGSAKRLVETVMGLETVKDIRALRPLLQHSPA